MFPKPQCPICGTIFETVGEVIAHMEAQTCQPLAPMQNYAPMHSESPDRVPSHALEDPTARAVEDAG